MRRTPIIAFILAPFVLWAVVMAFSRVLLPLGAKTWYSEVSVRARMAIGNRPMRLQALHDAAGVREPGAALVGLLVEAARSDPARLRAYAGLAQPWRDRPPPGAAGGRGASAGGRGSR